MRREKRAGPDRSRAATPCAAAGTSIPSPRARGRRAVLGLLALVAAVCSCGARGGANPVVDAAKAAASDGAARRGADAGVASGRASGCEGAPPAPARDFRDETIYFVLTTRFFDGDPANNFHDRDRVDPSDPTWRGDFKGLIEKLDYIHDTLGFTALWITPVVENRSGLSYHGYHPYDFTRVDPRLESPGATFQDLVCEVHKRGMRLVLDVVLNHSSSYGIRGKVWNAHAPVKYFKMPPPFPSSDPAYPYKLHLGNYLFPNREDDDNPLAPSLFRVWDPDGARDVVCPRDGQTIRASGFGGQHNHDPRHFFEVDPTALDPTWYHQQGFIAAGDWENPSALQSKHMAGDTIDLATGSPVVFAYLVDAYERFLDMGVDAFRIDALKHISRDEVLPYVRAFQAHKPDLFQFGEVLVKGAGWGTCLDPSDDGPAQIRPWWYTRTTTDCTGRGRDDSGLSVLDFSLMSTFRDNLSQGRFTGVSAVFARDHLYGDATKLVTFLDNHDVGPQREGEHRFAGTDEALASALSFLWLVRGIPALFYGTEVRFQAGKEIDGRGAPHADSGRAYFGDHLTGARLAETQANELVKHIKRLNLIRASSPALSRGVMAKYGETDGSFWALRDHAGTDYAVIGLSQHGDTIRVPGVPEGTYRDAVSGREIHVPRGGTLTFDVPAAGAGVYVRGGVGRVGAPGAYLR